MVDINSLWALLWWYGWQALEKIISRKSDSLDYC